MATSTFTKAEKQIGSFAGIEFMAALFFVQLVCLIPLSRYLTGLDWQVAITYMLIPMGFVVYSMYTQTQVRGLKLKDIAVYASVAFWVTAAVGYFFFTRVDVSELGAYPKDQLWSIVATQVFFVAPAEEMAFRFIIPNIIKNRLKKADGKDHWLEAGIVSAVLFAGFHWTAYQGSINSVIVALVIGLIWMVVYQKWGLGATIGSHASYNLLVSGILTGNAAMFMG